jgi:hypothetical protein
MPVNGSTSTLSEQVEDGEVLEKQVQFIFRMDYCDCLAFYPRHEINNYKNF